MDFSAVLLFIERLFGPMRTNFPVGVLAEAERELVQGGF
jgi:hypothetical protein